MKGKMMMFSDEKKLREFTATKLTPKESQKDFLKYKNYERRNPGTSEMKKEQ